MCGIAGVFSFLPDGPPAALAEVERMTNAMANRGPDGEGRWASPDGHLVLGHRRLAILDLTESGAQPMHSDDGRLTIVFNGEIYNFRELRKQLAAKEHRFQSTSDTEVILALYREKGVEFLRDLRGMFAFAIWDADRRGLFLARDPFGIKPLYYANDGQAFRFASQVKALMAGGQVDPALDPAGLAGYFGLGFVLDPFTVHKAVRALPAGHWSWVDDRGPSIPKAYYSIQEVLAEAEEVATRAPERVEQLRVQVPEMLLDTVRHHLVSDVPVGLFLSSGLDSSALLSLTREAGATDIRAVTLGFKEFAGLPEDETPLAHRAAQHFGVEHQARWLDRETFAKELDRALRFMDQPSVDGLNTYFVAKAAADAGMKVALSGLGGDELFGGYPSFRQVPRMATWLSPFRHTPTLGRAFRTMARPLTGRRVSPKWAGLLEYGPQLAGAYFLRRALYLPWEFQNLPNPVDLSRGWEELDLLTRLNEAIRGLSSPRAKLIALEVGCYMQNQLLRDSDWASMAHSLELRTPLVDATLLQNLAPLLVSPKVPTRSQVVRSLPSSPPEEVIKRPKTGFNMPIREWAEDIRGHRSAERGIRGWARFLVSALPEAPSLANLRLTPREQQRVLIFRLGSLGDTVVALPSFHLIAKAFPAAHRAVLTNFPEHHKAPHLSAVLGESGLVQEYLEYPPNANPIKKLRHTRRQIRNFRPDVVIYLMPVRTKWQIYRDRAFFRLCGIHHMIGVPKDERQRTGLMNSETGLWTHESERLLSTLSHLGRIDSWDTTAWNFHFSKQERGKANIAMHALPSGKPILAISLGTKNPVNEWGHEKWMELLTQLSCELRDWSLLLVGAQGDYEPSQRLAEIWPNPVQNLCGTLSPRESAIALEKSALFLGQDSGPMHLAAAVGVPCIAVYSARNPPGEWFPYGKNHEVIYHRVPCSGCRLTVCIEQKKRCINEIHPLEVKDALGRILAKLNGKSKCKQ